jgi:hypothetical protein
VLGVLRIYIHDRSLYANADELCLIVILLTITDDAVNLID